MLPLKTHLRTGRGCLPTWHRCRLQPPWWTEGLARPQMRSSREGALSADSQAAAPMPEPPAPTTQGWAVCPHLLLSRCVDGRARGAQPSLRDRDKGAKEGCPRSGHLAPVFRAPGSLSPGPLSSLLQALVTVSAHRAPPELPHGASTPHSVPTASPPRGALSLCSPHTPPRCGV